MQTASPSATMPLPGTNCGERGVVLDNLPLAPQYGAALGCGPAFCPVRQCAGEKRCIGGNAVLW